MADTPPWATSRASSSWSGRRLLDSAHTTLLLDGKVALAPNVEYAYGFIDRVVNGRRFVGHSGGAARMNGDLAFEPDGGYIVVVLSNLEPPAAGKVAGYILARLPSGVGGCWVITFVARDARESRRLRRKPC